MTLELDHVIIAVHDLDSGILEFERMGYTVIRGGIHANRATENALITFADGTYLELLTRTGETPLPGLIDFGVLLDGRTRMPGFALRSDDLDADAARLRSAGIAVGESVPGRRRRKDGALVEWKLALIEDGFHPFLIQDVTPRDWRISNQPDVTTHRNGISGLRGVLIAACDPAETAARYRRLLGGAADWLELEAAPELDRPEALAGLTLRLRLSSSRHGM